MNQDKKERIIEYLSGFINEERKEKLENILNQRTRHVTVVLEDIYQPQNASAVVRTAECLGIQELHVIENRNEYVVNRDVVQGASKWIDINRYNSEENNNTEACLMALKDRGYKIIATSLSKTSMELPDLEIDQPLALCFGSEDLGLSDDAYELSDEHMTIPMYGFTQSYNLSVSAGISLYKLCEKIRNSELNWQLSQEDKDNLLIQWLTNSTPNGKALLEKICEADL